MILDYKERNILLLFIIIFFGIILDGKEVVLASIKRRG